MKRLSIGVMVVCLALTQMVFAQGTKDTGTAAQTKVTLDIMGTDVQKKLLDVWIPEFERQNPDLKVEYNVLDWGTGKTKILTSFAGGMGADVVMVYGADVPQWIEHGALSPIDEYFDQEPFLETAYNLGSWEGKQYAIPWVTKIVTYYYRTDKYIEAGLDPSNPPSTWQEFIDVSKKLTKRDAAGNLVQNGTWITTSHPWKTVGQFAAFLWSAGGSLFSEDGTRVTVNNEIGVETANFIRDLLYVHRVDEPGSILNEETDFVQGKMASGVCNNAPRGMEVLHPEIVKYVAVALPPSKDGTTARFGELGGDYIGISSTAKNRDAAARLVKYLTHTPEIVVQMCIDSFGPPALKAAIEPFSHKSQFADDWFEITSNHAKVQPLHPRWLEIQQIFTKALDLIYLNRNANTKQIFDDAAVQINKILAESGPTGGE